MQPPRFDVLPSAISNEYAASSGHALFRVDVETDRVNELSIGHTVHRKLRGTAMQQRPFPACLIFLPTALSAREAQRGARVITNGPESLQRRHRSTRRRANQESHSRKR